MKGFVMESLEKILVASVTITPMIPILNKIGTWVTDTFNAINLAMNGTVQTVDTVTLTQLVTDLINSLG